MDSDAGLKRRVPDGWAWIGACGSCGSQASRPLRTVRGVGIVRCSACSTVRAEAVIPPDALYGDGYHSGTSGAIDFDYTDPHNQAYEAHNAHRRLAFLERFGPRGRLVDVGGGIGTFARVAGERGWRATLLEPAPDAVEHARAMGVDARVGVLEDLDPAGERYDAVSFVHVLEHLPEAREALRRAAAVVHPGGRIFIELPHYGSMSRLASKDDWLGWRPGQHVYFFTKRTLGDLLARAGLEVASIGTICLTWDEITLMHYAHILGLEPALLRGVAARRALRARQHGPAAEVARDEMVPPLNRETPAKRALAPVLAAIARAEERLGIGENLIAVARVPRTRR